jgi:hypothetical protein
VASKPRDDGKVPSAPRRLGLRAENRSSGARLTNTASAWVLRTLDWNHPRDRVIRYCSGETAPPRIETPAVRFSELTQRAGRIAPWSRRDLAVGVASLDTVSKICYFCINRND